jgi:hypothetical protein
VQHVANNAKSLKTFGTALSEPRNLEKINRLKDEVQQFAAAFEMPY